MATKISPYRTGQPRFGSKGGANWDPSVKTIQLSPEQLERYKAGEPLDQILAEGGEEEMGEQKVISFQKYKELEGKYKQLEEENEKLKQDLQQPSAVANASEEIETLKKLAADWESKVSSISAEYEALESETEKLKEALLDSSAQIDALQREIESVQDQFNEAMAAKENAVRELSIMKNQAQGVQTAFKEQREMYQTLSEQYHNLLQDTRPLMCLVYNKLKQDLGEGGQAGLEE